MSYVTLIAKFSYSFNSVSKTDVLIPICDFKESYYSKVYLSHITPLETEAATSFSISQCSHGCL
jgi:hypothetical protein